MERSLATTEFEPVNENIASSEKPSRARFVVLSYLCVLAFVLYLDRICIAKAAPAITEELGLTGTQMGLVFAAFTLA